MGVGRVLAAVAPPAARAHTSWEGYVLLLALAALLVWLLWRRKARAGGRASAAARSDAAARAAGGDGGAGKGGDVRTASALQVFVVLDRDALSSVLNAGLPAVELAGGLGSDKSALLPVDSVRGGRSLERGPGGAAGLKLGERDFVYQLGTGSRDSRNGDRGDVPAAVPAGSHRWVADGVEPVKAYCFACGAPLPADGSSCPCFVAVSHD